MANLKINNNFSTNQSYAMYLDLKKSKVIISKLCVSDFEAKL